MINTRKSILLFSVASLTLATACTTPAHLEGSEENRSRTTEGLLIGGLIGTGIGAIVGNDVGGAVIGGAIGAAAGGVYGNFLDKQAAELRQDLGNDDVQIVNTGDRLIVTLPQDILFDIDSAVVYPNLRSDLLTVAGSLQDYPDSSVQIIGHTDNTGSAQHNQQLSERRAHSVADILLEGGVHFDRIQAFGRGEDQPVTSNLDSEGRRQNRRVEIVILPTA